MIRTLAPLVLLLVAVSLPARAADDCYAQAERFFQPTAESRPRARTWSPLEIVLHRVPQAPDQPPEEWPLEDPSSDTRDETASAERWKEARQYAERVRFDYVRACLPSDPGAPTCADAGKLLWQPQPASQRYAREWSAGELLFTRLDPDSPPPAWAQADARSANDPGERAAHWNDASRWAFALFHALATSCPPDALAPEGARVRAFKTPEPEEVLAHQPRLRRPGTPILPYVVGVPPEVPPPRGFQFAVSQLVTAGQAAFAPTIAGSPGASSENDVIRHTTLAFNLLFVQPVVGPGGPGTWAAPTFSSGDLFIGTTTEKSAFDWQNAVRRDAKKNEQKLDALQRLAFQRLVAAYRQLARGGQDRLALLSAHEIAHLRFLDAVDEYVQEAYVRPVEESNAVTWNVFARLRYTLDATWTPEIPDLFSASVGTRTNWLLAGHANEPRLSGVISLTGSFSAFPTTDFLKVSDVTGSSKRAALIDGSIGVLFELPDSSGLPNSKLSLSTLTRFAPLGRFDYSFGLSASLSVPFTENLGVVAAYTLRCDPARPPCFGTSGITIGGTFVP